MAKNKGKRRSKATQNRQSSPSKNASSATTREATPESSDTKSPSEPATSVPDEPAPQPDAPTRDAGMIRKVSSRVAQFEEAARENSLLNHERDDSTASPLRASVNVAESLHDEAHISSPSPGKQATLDDTTADRDEPELSDTSVNTSRNNSSHDSENETHLLKPISDMNPQMDDPLEGHSENNALEDSKASLTSPAAEPQIPQRSVAREVEPETVQMFEATRQPVRIARPVMLENIDDSRDNADSDVDLDSYFDSPDDVVVTAATVRKIDSPDTQESPRFADNEFDMDSATQTLPSDLASYPAHARDAAASETSVQEGEAFAIPQGPAASNVGGLRVAKLRTPDNSAQYFIRRPEKLGIRDGSSNTTKDPESLTSAKSPGSIRAVSSRPVDTVSMGAASFLGDELHMSDQDSGKKKPASRLGESFELSEKMDTLPPPPAFSPQSSPTASPRAYKYEQSPLPKLDDNKGEPPIIGVCVVGFHHQRGPEVEYWIGPDESQSSMWPYLPFQSLPDGSHQFEENVTYFMLLYDRDRHAATSLTFDRDEDGHIRQGTTDFRNVTTLFAVACSRQIPASDLKLSGDEEYTRSTVQKSVVVIASKPLFGPIKEKLTVVTRSYFAQQNFGDRGIIDHFYHNLVQMPLWTNENDLHVGMNLQKCIHDFGAQVLYLFKAMLLETKILFYASDTDVLGTTQFALVSLIPNLINHLEDSGSPLLSSYELDLQRPTHVSSSDRQSLLKYFGLPLQLFAGGGVFSPFVPLQQFEDLKQPETQYGMMGTTNKLFLGTDIDFDVVVNVDTNEVTARNPDVAALLQLTEQDKAFITAVQKAVNTAWDTHDNWQPQALGYYGGEDYIRHEFEEYLMALLASAKYEQHGGSELSSTSSPLQPYGTAWAERWMRTNNFRISNRTTDKRLFDLIDPVHPGVKLQKPSGIERFFGIFKSSNNPRSSEVPKSSSASVASQTSSTPRTPSLASGEKFGDQPTPSTPSTPRRWFWQSEPRDRFDAAKADPAVQAEVAKGHVHTEEDKKVESEKLDGNETTMGT